MYKSWIKALGLSLLIVSSSLFLELGIEGTEYIAANTINLVDHEAKPLGVSRWKKSALKKIVETLFIQDIKEGCALTNVKMEDGESGIFYSQKTVPMGTSCDLYAQERSCKKGTISGNKKYKHSACSQERLKHCSVKGYTVFHGKSAVFYKEDHASAKETCENLSQKRFCVNGKMTGDYIYNKFNCTSAQDEECFLLGANVGSSNDLVFYKTPFVPYGEQCSLQLRSCVDGTLSGRYNYNSCFVESPKSCYLGLSVIPHGENKLFYKKSLVQYEEECQSQTRECDEGNLSGDNEYKESFCRNKIPKSCKIGDELINHGESKLFYNIEKALPGEVCRSEKRTCNNGRISGNKEFSYKTCLPFEKKSCEIYGMIIPDGEFVDLYSESISKTCKTETRKCEDGVLFGNTNYNRNYCRIFRNCKVADHFIKHNSARVFYKEHKISNAKDKVELRVCNDGNLSGTFMNFYAYNEKSETCFFSGSTIRNNESKVFYSKKVVPYGTACKDYGKDKFCVNGKVKSDTIYVYETCEVAEKPIEEENQDCLLNGKTIKNKQSLTYYKKREVPYGTDCEPEKRMCSNGNLSGTYTNISCSVKKGKTCVVAWNELDDGESRVFYSKPNTAYGDYCELYKQKRTCNNGILTGSNKYFNATCLDYKKKSCTMDGVTVDDGEFAMFYSENKLLDKNNCIKQARTCTDGTFIGDEAYKYSTCTSLNSCKIGQETIRSNISLVFYKDHTVRGGNMCRKEIRTCDDGSFTGSFTNQSCFIKDSNSCLFSDVSIKEGEYKVFYSQKTVSSGKNCINISKKKFCLGGKVSGDMKYIYSTCSEEK